MSIDRAKAMQAAQKYLAKGQLDKAITEYERLVQGDPKDARTLLKLGDLYTRKGANKEAGATYRKVAEQYADQGFFLKAVAVCKQILKLDPTQLDVWEKLAEMYELLSLASDALSTYEQVADAHVRAGNPRKALHALQKVADLDAENVAARIRYAEALSKLNRTEEAIEAFALGADALKKQGRIDDYLKVAERLLFHKPDDAALSRDIAAAYLERGETKLALSKLQTCFNADPKDVATLRLLAKAFEQLGQVQKTISVLKEISRLHAAQERPHEQGSVLRKIVALDPNDNEARRELSQLMRADTRATMPEPADGTAADYDDVILVEDDEDEPTQRKSVSGVRRSVLPAEDPRSAQIARLLGECSVFMRYGLYDKMITQLHQVLDIDPRSVEARGKLKEVYLKTNKPAEAVMQMIMIAEVVAETDAASAREHLREALLLDPTNQAVAERLQSLERDGDDDIIVVDDGDEGVTVDSMRPEESFASVIPDKDPEETALAPDDEPEMILEAESDDIEGIATADARSDAEIAADADELQTRALPRVSRPAKTPAPAELPAELEEALEEVDFYLKQDLREDALEMLFDLLLSYPNHPALLAKRAEIEGAGEGGDDDQAFALAQKLADEVEPAAASGGGPVDVADVLAQFKQGVARQIDRNDAATHYDLGIAYMEMQLHAEAIEEFNLCLSDPARECTTHTMIGLSYVAKGEMEPGIGHFKHALEAKPSEEEELGLWFEIGNAHELLGKKLEALVWYEKVEEKNPTFRDVAQRIERLGVARTPQQDADEFDTMFDNMIVKD